MKYSFIVPNYNFSSTLNDCIESILNQDKTLSFEVIVVDNDSFDGSQTMLSDKGVIVISNGIKSRSVSRNLGARKAKGEYLCFVDADIKLSPSWLKEVHHHLKENSATDVIGTKVIPYKEIQTDPATDYNYQAELMRVSIRPLSEGFVFINTQACIYRKEFFLNLGGFDENLLCYEDMDLSRRATLAEANFIVIERTLGTILNISTSLLRLVQRAHFNSSNLPRYLEKWTELDRKEIASKVIRSEWNKLIYFIKFRKMKLVPLLSFAGYLTGTMSYLLRDHSISVLKMPTENKSIKYNGSTLTYSSDKKWMNT